jgi:hypothetical protein
VQKIINVKLIHQFHATKSLEARSLLFFGSKGSLPHSEETLTRWSSIEEMVSKDFCFHFIAVWFTAKTFTHPRKYGSQESSSRMGQSPHWTCSSGCAFDDRNLWSPGLVPQIRMSPFLHSKRISYIATGASPKGFFLWVNGGYVPQT